MVISTPRIALFPTDDSFSRTKIDLFGAEMADIPQSLLPHSSNDDTYRAIHASHEIELPAIGCHIFKNVRVVDGVNYASSDAIALDPDLVPAYWRDQIAQGVTGNLYAVAGRPTRIVDGPALSIMSLGYPAYGHWWLDILPRIWLLRQLFGRSLVRQILVPDDVPDYGLSLLSAFGFDESVIVRFSPKAETIFVRTLVVPSLLHSSYTFHSVFRAFICDAIARMGGTYKGLPGSKLFVSRRRYLGRSAGEARTLDNETELAEVAMRRGYQVIYPEELDWAGKVDAFSSARVIIGEFGSSLHHSIFSQVGARVGAIGILNNTQSSLGTICSHRNLYIKPEEISVGGLRKMHVAIDSFSEALDCLESA